ncbi:MAG TPA: DinB family protein [Candidatus Acidoferrales bacterium]|jgi:uncharacterized damage-inducible protein DinB|nr:DinB family protein [Candidatus Acidoferrales bacterium]
MKNIFTLFLFGSLLALPAAAQNAPPATANPLSTWLRNAYTMNRNNIVKSADKMPEENYGMRPGPQEEVRTFGQQVGHVARFNYLWCAQARGEKNPAAGMDLEKLATKPELMKALNDAFAYCDTAYAALTDASGLETIDITQESGKQTRNLRMALLILNYGHNNEIYGNLVTYLRIKSIVPSSSEPRPAAPPMQPQK